MGFVIAAAILIGAWSVAATVWVMAYAIVETARLNKWRPGRPDRRRQVQADRRQQWRAEQPDRRRGPLPAGNRQGLHA
jgi:hypothetical protein